jgi:hypothetical protein
MLFLGRDFRLPWPAKIAARMLTPGKWWPFEIYLTTTWTAPYFDHTYLGFPSIKSNGFFTKTKEASKNSNFERILKMLCFWQIVFFLNWEILAFQFFQASLKPTTLRKQTLLK